MAQKIVVIETTYGCVDAEMDDEERTFERVYADHFATMKEAEEYAKKYNETHGAGGRYLFRAARR